MLGVLKLLTSLTKCIRRSNYFTWRQRLELGANRLRMWNEFHYQGECANMDWDLTCVWHSAIFRSPSTHSCRARAFCARNFNISPLAQLIVNVLESSSLGHTTAPAKCSWIKEINQMIQFSSGRRWSGDHFTCHLGVLPLIFGGDESSLTLSQI